MKRANQKKSTERRSERRSEKTKGRASQVKAMSKEKQKKPRVRTSSTQQTRSSNERSKVPASDHTKRSTKTKESCHFCNKGLNKDDRVLFVEEEVGRTFCSESCISEFFTPEINKLEKEYFKRVSSSDLSGDERESLSHLRWITLQEPDEIWREKTLSGDHRFTLISEFQPENKRIWCICICLFLRGEPSFLYLAFPTRNAAMTNHYRRGERVELTESEKGEIQSSAAGSFSSEMPLTDGLASDWTEDETLRAKIGQDRNSRSSGDIPPEEYGLYQGCFEETLEQPDEVWSLPMPGDDSLRLFHFIKHYPDEKPQNWFIVVAREVEDDEQIEILDAFPTRDNSLVERYRKGEQEISVSDTRPMSRTVH